MNRALGLGAAAVFLTLLVHSLFYAGFFEDPIVWGVIALAAWALLAAPQRSPAPRDTQVVEPATRDRRPERTPAELQHQAPLAD